ncbi:MAG: O-antigen ligase family protein [Bryobacteraceae bacterium]
MNYELSILQFAAAIGLALPLGLIAAIQRPRLLLWLYFATFTLFPKFVYVRLGNQLYPAVAASCGAISLLLVLAALHRKRGFTPFHRRYGIRTLFVALSLTYAATTLIPLALNALGIGNPLAIPISTKANGASLVFFEYAVAFSGFIFLDCLSAVDTLLRLVTSLATLGSLEAVLFYYVRIGGVLEPYAINRYGQLDGVTFGSPDALARIIGIAVFAVLYFAARPGLKFLYGLLPLFALGLVATQNRATAVSILAGLILYTALRGRTRGRSAVFVAWLWIAAIGVAAFGVGVTRLLDAELSSVRSDYKDPSNALARLVIAQRGVDVAWHTFPLGVGSGQVPYYMNSPEVESLFGEAEYYDNRPLYYAIRSGSLLTSVHNLYLNFVIESGVLGVVVLVLLGALLVRTFLHAWRRRDLYRRTPLDAIFALLASIALNVGADSTFRPYALYLCLTWSAVLIAYGTRTLETRMVLVQSRQDTIAEAPVEQL